MVAHRQARDRRLRSEYGWLSLVGRWIVDAEPQRLPFGEAVRIDGAVHVHFDPGIGARDELGPILAFCWPAQVAGPEPYFWIRSVRYELLRQGDRAAIRARDPAAPARRDFRGLDFFPFDPGLRVEARLVREGVPEWLPMTSGLGAEERLACPGALHFTLDGRPRRLLALFEDASARQLFVPFRDRTSGRETYGAGRFLYLPLPSSTGGVTLDFNLAFNPPCALTEFAACPIVPPENVLDMAIRGGEQVFTPA